MTGDHEPFNSALTETLSLLNMHIDTDQLRRMRLHFDRLIETNRITNLTRITDPKAAAAKHYADSLALLPWIEKNGISVGTVLDLGTGGGFPSIPLAIMRPNWSITAIDGTAKKIAFVRRAASAIGITNLQCIHAHSSHWTPAHDNDHPPQNWFDLVVCRALASLPKAIETAASFVRPGGHLVVYQSDNMDQEKLITADAAATSSALQKLAPFSYTLGTDTDAPKRALYAYTMPPSPR